MPTSIEEIEDRFAYHPADTAERIQAHEYVRGAAAELALGLNHLLPESREKSLALTAVQEVAMWANAAIAIHFAHAEDSD